MKIFVEKPSITRGIYRAYIFASGRYITASSTKSSQHAVELLKEATHKVPEGFQGGVEEWHE